MAEKSIFDQLSAIIIQARAVRKGINDQKLSKIAKCKMAAGRRTRLYPIFEFFLTFMLSTEIAKDCTQIWFHSMGGCKKSS